MENANNIDDQWLFFRYGFTNCLENEIILIKMVWKYKVSLDWEKFTYLKIINLISWQPQDLFSKVVIKII